jgi:hypothetical protein
MNKTDMQPALTDTKPDGTFLTVDDLIDGDVVQVWVGSWPFDTSWGRVVAASGRLFIQFDSASCPCWISRRRIACIMRPAED